VEPVALRPLLVAAAITAALTAICIAVVDLPLAEALAPYAPSSAWDRGVDLLEVLLLLPLWKWASVAVLAGATVAAFAVPRWRAAAPAWLLVTATHLISRLAMGWIKDGTGRLRPSEWHGGPTFFQPHGISFPSGHVVLFAGVLVPLAITCPRTRPLLAVVGFVMIARIAAHAHFASDVLGALTLVTLVAWGCGSMIRRLPGSRR